MVRNDINTRTGMAAEQTPLIGSSAAADTAPNTDQADVAAQPPIASRVYRLLFGPPVCPPGIDPRPKFRPNGDRVFLMDQRGPTRSELGWTLATFPIHAFRRHRLPTDRVQLLEQAASLPDPTVIVPTVDIGVELVNAPDSEVVSKRLAGLRERRRKLDEENERWLGAGMSRKERLRSIDRRTLWTRDGKPVFMMARREHTWLETFLSTVTLPYLFWRSWKAFSGAMRKAKDEEREFIDPAEVPDPTVVIPTGKSLFLEEELSATRPKDADLSLVGPQPTQTPKRQIDEANQQLSA